MIRHNLNPQNENALLVNHPMIRSRRQVTKRYGAGKKTRICDHGKGNSGWNDANGLSLWHKHVYVERVV